MTVRWSDLKESDILVFVCRQFSHGFYVAKIEIISSQLLKIDLVTLWQNLNSPDYFQKSLRKYVSGNKVIETGHFTLHHLTADKEI